MDSTPKLQRKSSLSLSSRLNKKRHSASPQSLVKSSAVNASELNDNCDVAARSPSIISVCSDGGIECTPPHKKSTRSMEEATDSDYSPQVFDSSFSPTCFLSQTMCVDSPEVGWKWKLYNDDNSSRTPDSAYAADSSFTSAGSSSTEVMLTARARRDNYRKRRASDARKDQEFRRMQKLAADEKLKQRFAMLEEQIRNAGIPTIATEKTKTVTKNSASFRSIDMDVNTSDKNSDFKIESPSRAGDKLNEKTPAVACENKLEDFFNDSDDCFLLAATQEIELKINTSPPANDAKSMSIAINNNTKFNCNDNSSTASATASAACASTCDLHTCNAACLTKEKRSSFYMKFLEDDCTDDWFISLDEAVLEATQSKKPRTSLLRYNSMPTNSNAAKVKSESTVNKIDSLLNEPAKSFAVVGGPSSEDHSPKMKRHSSSHALRSASTNYRDREYHLNK